MIASAFVVILSRWYPARLNDAYWLYITTGGTLDAFSIVTLGLLALCVALVAQASAAWLRAFAAGCAVIAILVAAIYSGLLSSLPEVMLEASENSFNVRTVKYGIVRASMSALLTVGMCAWFAITAWKRSAAAHLR